LTEPSTTLFADYHPSPAGQRRAPLPEGIVFAAAGSPDVEGIARLIAAREGFTHEQALERARRWLAMPTDKHFQLVARLDSSVVAHGRAAYTCVEARAGQEPVPIGWYLSGVTVDPTFRRRGIGRELTRRRLAWIAERATEAFYFANSRNLASIDLHRPFGFEEICRPFQFPGATFSGGIGVLFRARLPVV
jgi:GNAT superfamily N-acetyltransferase